MAQLLSRSVSWALLFCKEQQIPGFEGMGATAEFSAVVDDTFDLTNACHLLVLCSRAHSHQQQEDHIDKNRLSLALPQRPQGCHGQTLIQGQ